MIVDVKNLIKRYQTNLVLDLEAKLLGKEVSRNEMEIKRQLGVVLQEIALAPRIRLIDRNCRFSNIPSPLLRYPAFQKRILWIPMNDCHYRFITSGISTTRFPIRYLNFP